MIVMRKILNPGRAQAQRSREKEIRDNGFNQNLPFLHLI